MRRICGLFLCVLVVALVACSDNIDLPTGGGFAEDINPPVKVTGSTSGGEVNVIDGERNETKIVIGR